MHNATAFLSIKFAGEANNGGLRLRPAGRPLGVPYERLVEHIQIDGADRFSRFLILAFIGFLVASLVIFLGCILVVIAALIGFDQFIILRGPVR